MPIARAGLELILIPGDTYYVGLLTAEPDLDAGTYVEVGDSSYARQAHNGWAWSGTTLAIESTGTLTFPPIVDASVTVTWWAIFTTSGVGTGDMLACGPLQKGLGEPPAQFVLEVGDEAEFFPGAILLQAEEG